MNNWVNFLRNHPSQMPRGERVVLYNGKDPLTFQNRRELPSKFLCCII